VPHGNLNNISRTFSDISHNAPKYFVASKYVSLLKIICMFVCVCVCVYIYIYTQGGSNLTGTDCV
jgi:hypothetical protein